MLVVCYTTAVLGMNASLVLWLALGSMYTRSLYGLGHVYIGHGQPVVLRVALGAIETLSGCFRSVSLSLRVVCNATAGHVLLAVLVEMTSVAMVATTGSFMVYTMAWMGPLVALKATTCVIQGVVYSRLLTVYSEECISSRVGQCLPPITRGLVSPDGRNRSMAMEQHAAMA